jgi:16S rRNA (guanine(966)-N(2))-methyltransferase RsmD
MSKKSSTKMEFAVVAGDLKGRRVRVPDLGVTRPPLTRLRKSIFDFLGPYLAGARYLDLFSGTGSYLFEAVSRGATEAVGVEKERALVEAVNEHARTFGVSDRLRCFQEDVFAALRRLHDGGRQFEIITMAPPQYKGLVKQTLDALREHPLFTASGLIVCQHDSIETRDIVYEPYPVLQRRKYGNTTFTIVGPPDS